MEHSEPLNGDLLPDKVFRESSSDPVQYRLNQSGPDGGTTFGPPTDVIDLDDLSSEFSIGVAGGPEAHFGIAVQFSIAGDLSVGREYFEDVNNDGLMDFVKYGTVYFNRLDNLGVPTFATDSNGTPVPIDDGSGNGSATIPDLDALDEVEAVLQDQSLLEDTVRRWVAPFDGTINIDAPVTLSPPVDETSLDGVRVARSSRAAVRIAVRLAEDGIITPQEAVMRIDPHSLNELLHRQIDPNLCMFSTLVILIFGRHINVIGASPTGIPLLRIASVEPLQRYRKTATPGWR